MVRIKVRYVAAELHFSDLKVLPTLELLDVLAALKRNHQFFFGDLGLAKLARMLQIKYFFPLTGLILI